MSPSPYHLSHILNIYPKEDTIRIGYALPQGQICRNVVSAGSRSEASVLLGKASKQLDEGKRIDDFLEDIACLDLCKRLHRDQALRISAKWQTQIDHTIAVQKPSAEHKSNRPAPVSHPSSVAHGLSRRDIDAEWPLKVTRSLGAPGSFQSSRSQQSQSQSPAQRDTRLVIQSFTLSTSISTASESEEDPSSEMFARNTLARRVLMPSAKFNIQADPASKEEPRFKCIIEPKASSSCLAAVRYPKAISTAAPTLEDMHRTLDEYMAKVRRMEPGPDMTGFKEDLEEKRLLIMEEVKDLVPPALRRRASRGTQTDLPEVVEKKDSMVDKVIAKPEQKGPCPDTMAFKEDLEKKEPLMMMQEVKDMVPPALPALEKKGNSVSRGTQTSLPEAVEKKNLVVDEAIAEPERMEPGEDLTDKPKMDIEKAKSSLITQIAQVAGNLKPADDVKSTATTTASNAVHEDKKANIIEQQSEPVPDPSKPVEIEQSPESESPDKTEDMVQKDTKKDIFIITNIYELSTSTPTSSEDLTSLSYSSSSSSSYSSLNPFRSPNSSVSSLVTLASPHPSTAMQHPQFNDKEYKGVGSKDSNPFTSPYLSTSELPPSQPLALQIRAGNAVLPSPRPPDRSPYAYPTLTHSLALVLATVEGFRWLVDTILLSYYLLFEGRDMRVFFWVGMYLWVLSCLGLL